MVAITLRLIVTPSSIHKITIDEQNGMELHDIIIAIMQIAQQKNIELPQCCALQYHDKDFNDFFSLVDADCITNLCTLKVVSVADGSADPSSSGEPDANRSFEGRKSGEIPNPFKLPSMPSAIQLFM
jgi:hypothetical protein